MAAAAVEQKPWEGGVLLVCGGTDFAQLGRTGGKTKKEDLDKESAYPNLLRPTRLKTFSEIKVMWCASGPAACHCFVGDNAGNLWSWGRNEKGQLGHGDFCQRNVPAKVAAVQGSFVIGASGGRNHSACVCEDGSSYAWGINQHGQCGTGQVKPAKPPSKEAGGTSSFCTGVAGQVHCWGKLKVNGDNQMYPAAVNDLVGWNVRSFACGPATFGVAADTAVITWGAATNGELGFGPNKKSSANPAKCEPLDGGYTHQVACGIGFTMFLVDPAHPRLAEAPEWESAIPVEEAPVPGEAAGPGKGGKRKAGEAAGGAAAKGKKAK
ncbi:Protein RCC2 [Tetrabaena socialis]|uniref:Protein RCC2 n=1 Tax=Tetrabaena socialis TaxID=47790 RepID=A0A2J7ZYE7_9CHLO|nr:Protein RCC2 [Tetrabaena socialis]|eukprot:PNH05291.1 Protein RCC2 [Tetrabaena socialis]